MTVAALARLDPAGVLLRPSGAADLETIRGHVARRVAREPRLRQVLLLTRWWQGPPVWVPDARFDIASRVLSATVPDPGDEPALLRLCCDLSRPALDVTRKPWELWVLSGLDDGGLALLLRLHHVVADGAAALDLFSALFDPAPAPPPASGGMPRGPDGGIRPAHLPSDIGRPGPRQLFLDNMDRNASRLWNAVRKLPRALRPVVVARGAVGASALARLLLAHGYAPALSFNRPVTAERQLALVRADLDAARSAAHARGATVNDVLLAAIGHGVRALLGGRGELTPGLVLHLSVPVSLRRAGRGGMHAAGNRVAVRPMWVPLDEADPARGLAALARTTRAVKRLPPLQPSGALGQRWVVRVMRRQRLVNLIVSNVVGPAAPLWFQGVPVRELFQVGVAGVQGNLSITVGALSYAGQLTIDVASDAVLVPDIEAFVQGVTEALEDLGALLGAGTR